MFGKNKLKFGDVYAVHKGTYMGHLLVFIEHKKDNDTYGFISINNLQNINVPSKDLTEGIKTNLLRKTVDVLPKDVRTLCFKQYKFNIDNPQINVKVKEDENIDS